MISHFFWEDIQNNLMVPRFIFEQKEVERVVYENACQDKKYLWYLILGVATAEEYREQRHPLHNWAWLKTFCIYKVSQK